MFGISSFAAAPFASLAGVFLYAEVSESASASDAIAAALNFSSAIAESVTASDQVDRKSVV